MELGDKHVKKENELMNFCAQKKRSCFRSPPHIADLGLNVNVRLEFNSIRLLFSKLSTPFIPTSEILDRQT
jgi:hypothetical protein